MYIFVIKEIREKANLSIKALSEMTGISRAYIYDLEHNRRINPTLQSLIKIADALNVNVKDLFYTKLDIEDLRNKMHECIDKYGINAKETMEISQLLDLVLNISDEYKKQEK